jgi:fanconi anemia group J protein
LNLGTPLTVNYANWSKPSFFDKLGDAIATVVEAIPFGGALVFLPSYSFLQKCVHAWKPPKTEGWVHRLTPHGSSTWERLLASKGSVIIEPTGSQRLFEIARDTYDRAIREKGRCILLAVFRGKMSEGISFNDDYARCVICVGLPYPNAFNRSIKAKRIYNDEQRKLHGRKDLLSGNEWYAQQAYRAIAQALGRCIRHASDYGTIILMDSRQCDHGVPREGELCQAHSKLPKWMRHSVKNMSSQHSFGDPSDQVIPGGWSGLKNKIQEFFVEAPSRVHSQQSVRKQQTNQSGVSSKSNENILQPTSNDGQSCGTDIITANEEFMEGTITRIVTPPTPMIYDWIYS